ncbi:MAG: hypothetical protein ACKN9T_15145 [Candidatus Methylumidiphilus sp.]
MFFKIGEIAPNTPHLFADLAELLLLVDPNGRGWIHKNDLLDWRTFANTSLEEVDKETEDMEGLGSAACRHGREESQLEDVWTQLEYRAGAMRQYYPFTVQGEKLHLCGVLNIQQRAYRLLLACSRLRSFENSGGIRQRWAKSFARISHLALQGLMPNHADIRIFDANSDDRRHYYKTDLREALFKLAEDLAFKPNEEECRKAGSSGDGGIDLVGVVTFGDGAIGNFAIAGQCGAQEKDWPSKKLESSPVNFRNYMNVLFDWPSIMFTPVCYRSATGEWVDNRSTTGVLLVDRFRILCLLDKAELWEVIANAEWFSSFEKDFSRVKCE